MNSPNLFYVSVIAADGVSCAKGSSSVSVTDKFFNRDKYDISSEAKFVFLRLVLINATSTSNILSFHSSFFQCVGLKRRSHIERVLGELRTAGLISNPMAVKEESIVPDQTIFPDATIPRDDIIKELSARYKYAVEDREFQDILELCSVHGISEDEIRGTERDRTLPRLEEVIQSLETKRVLSAGEMVRIGMAHDLNLLNESNHKMTDA